MKNVIKSFFNGFQAHGSSSEQAVAPAKPLFTTGHENESIKEHLGTLNDDPNDGYGNNRLDEGSSHAGTVSTEKKIPPAF